MKRIVLLFFLLSSLSGATQGNPSDTVIRGVKISFTYSRSIFPGSWQPAPINASGEQIDTKEIRRSLDIVIKAIQKYPVAALKNELTAVYFLKSLKFYDVGYGGTNSSDALFLTNNGVDMGFTDLYLEQTFHHEYSSILYRRHPQWLDARSWLAANAPGFDYNDPENGVGAIRNNASSQELDSNFCKKGFLTQYSQSSLENDLNTFAQNLFSPSDGFWKLVDRYPKVRKKMKLLVQFYQQMDPVFTEEYFRKIK